MRLRRRTRPRGTFSSEAAAAARDGLGAKGADDPPSARERRQWAVGMHRSPCIDGGRPPASSSSSTVALWLAHLPDDQPASPAPLPTSPASPRPRNRMAQPAPAPRQRYLDQLSTSLFHCRSPSPSLCARARTRRPELTTGTPTCTHAGQSSSRSCRRPRNSTPSSRSASSSRSSYARSSQSRACSRSGRRSVPSPHRQLRARLLRAPSRARARPWLTPLHRSPPHPGQWLLVTQ